MSSDSACNWRGRASGCAPDAISISAHQSAKAKSAHAQNQRKHNQRSLKISQSKISEASKSIIQSQSKISAVSPIAEAFDLSSGSSVAFFSPSTRDQHAREHELARTFVGEGHVDGALFGCALALKKSAQISADMRTFRASSNCLCWAGDFFGFFFGISSWGPARNQPSLRYLVDQRVLRNLSRRFCAGAPPAVGCARWRPLNALLPGETAWKQSLVTITQVLPERGKSLYLEWRKRTLILIKTGNKP
jgi:hypothetical protein